MLDLLQLINAQGEVHSNIKDGLNDEIGGNFSIIHLNIRSVKKNFDEFLVYLELVKESIDIIVLSETWCVETVSDFNIPNFTAYHNESRFNQNDAVMVYIKNSLSANVSTWHLTNTNLISFTLEINNKSIGFITSYRPPSLDTGTYITEFEQFMTRMQKNNIEVFIGDININLVDKHSMEVNNYLNMLTQKGYVSYINSYTRVTENSTTIIDHIFIRQENSIKPSTEIKSMIFEASITDHYIISVVINFKGKHTQCISDRKQKVVKKNKLCKIKYVTGKCDVGGCNKL